jgi:hypothetical protein
MVGERASSFRLPCVFFPSLRLSTLEASARAAFGPVEAGVSMVGEPKSRPRPAPG